MRISFSSPTSAAPAAGRLADRLGHLSTWLAGLRGTPGLSDDEAFLARSTDHADCERRQRWLDQRHRLAWRDTPFP